jgi:hypothetical protein
MFDAAHQQSAIKFDGALGEKPLSSVVWPLSRRGKL